MRKRKLGEVRWDRWDEYYYWLPISSTYKYPWEHWSLCYSRGDKHYYAKNVRYKKDEKT